MLFLAGAASLFVFLPQARSEESRVPLAPEFQALCAFDEALCADYQRFKNKLDALALAAGGSQLPIDELTALNRELEGLDRRAEDIIYGKKGAAGIGYYFEVARQPLRGLIDRLSQGAVAEELAEISFELGELEQRMGSLEQDKGVGGLGELDKAGEGLWHRLQALGLNLDKAQSPRMSVLEESGWRRNTLWAASGRPASDEMNLLQERMDRLSRRAQAAARRWGPAGAAQARVEGLLAMSHMPQLAPFEQSMPLVELYTGVNARGDSADKVPEYTKIISNLKKAGKTRTVGYPLARSRLVFPQTDNTCAIAAQVEVLEEAGAPGTGPKRRQEMEGRLLASAIGQGYFDGNSADPKRRENGSVPIKYLGNLLNMPLKKHANASDEDLARAVSAGKMVLVGINAGAFFNDRTPGEHAVAVTGAEVNANGKVLGYYVNDTANDAPARFINELQFLNAWHAAYSVFIEPL